MNIYCLLNGDLLPVDNARLGIADLAIRRGYGVFDYLRIHDSRPLYLDAHLRRLQQGSAILRISPGYSTEQLREQVFQLIKTNAMPGITAMRMVVTGGVSAFEPETPSLILTQEIMTLPAASYYDHGAKLMSHEYQRELPQVKTTSYLTAIYLAEKMRDAGAMEILYHQGGQVTECTRSNIFVVKNGEVITPAVNILAGITRANVLKLASTFTTVHEDKVTLDDLWAADEVFITSTIKRIIPVTDVDGKCIGAGIPGPLTLSLMKRLHELDQKEEGSKSPAT